MLNNGLCDKECFTYECSFDHGDKIDCLEKFYVTSETINDYDGSINKPYPSIILALSNEPFMFAEILLIGYGNFLLSLDDSYSVNCFSNEKVFDVTIRPLLCSEINAYGCYQEDERAIIMISKAAVCMKIFQYITIKDVIFSQNELVSPYCETCNYCKKIRFYSENFYDDQDNIIFETDYVNGNYCYSFSNAPLFDLLKGSSLFLQVNYI